MLRLLSAAALATVALSLAACAAGGPDRDPNKEPAPTTTSKDGTQPTKDGGSSSSTSEGSSLGPECKAYLDCCDEVAASQPALAGSCDSTRSSIEQAQEKGASTAQYESSCKQALSSMKSAGYCK